MSNSISIRVLASAAIVSLAACSDGPTQATNLDNVDAAFASLPAGFNEVNSSFVGGDGPPMAFMPGMERGPGLAGPGGPRRGPGPMGGPGGGCMGGGLGLEFAGGVDFGRGPNRGPFGRNLDLSNCTYAAGDVTCTNVRNGITITSIHTFKKADGTAQERPDSSTDYHRARVTAEGTVTRGSAATSVINHRSDRVVTGLAWNSTERHVDGTSSGTENTTGTNREGAQFTAVRTVGDTIVGIVIPMADGKPTYPTAGTVTRSMKAVVTVAGVETVRSRREVITYNGSSTATIVITVNGETKTCSMPLPRGRLSCE